MKKLLAIASLLLLSSSLVKAQVSPSAKPQPDSIIRIVPVDGSRHTAYIYTIGDKIRTPEEVKIKLLAYAPAALEYHYAKTDATLGLVSTGGFVLSGFGAVLEFVHNNKDAGETTGIVNGKPDFIYQKHSLTGAYIFTGLAGAFLVSTFVHYIHAGKHSAKALNVYNQRFQ